MKNFKFIALTFVSVGILSSCSDDDNIPQIVNEEEVITTVTATFTPTGGGPPIILKSRDLDGDGPDAPIVTASGSFIAGITYNGSVTFLNELQSPAGDITEEIEEEGTEHQIFFVQNGSLGTFVYNDEDADGNPVGLSFTYSAAANATTGTLKIFLIHEPDKSAPGVAGGTMANAGGNTDAEVTFPISVVLP